MQEIAIYNKDHEVVKVSLREIASWRDSKILATTPYDESIDLIKLVDDYRNQAHIIELPINTNLDQAISILKERQEADYGDYRINFNGIWLYSININEIDAYVSITGMTREGCIKREQIERYRMQLHQEEQRLDAETNFQARIEDGKKEIIEAKWSSWEEFVEKYSRPPYYLHAIDTVTKYLGLLNKSHLSVTEIAQKFHEEFENDTGDHYTSCILTYIARFSRRGTDMFRAVAHIGKEKGQKLANNREYLKNIDNINRLIDTGIPYEEAENLVQRDIHDVQIGLELSLKLINIDEKLYEGFSNTGKYTIVARIGDYYATYLFNNDSYTRYITHIYYPDTLISTNERSVVEITKADITGVKMRNTIKSKAKIYQQTLKVKENVHEGLILQAYKEIRDLAQEIETNHTNSLVIDCIVDINKKKLTKRI